MLIYMMFAQQKWLLHKSVIYATYFPKDTPQLRKIDLFPTAYCISISIYAVILLFKYISLLTIAYCLLPRNVIYCLIAYCLLPIFLLFPYGP